MDSIFRDLTAIATAMIGVAMIAVLVQNAGGTASVISAAASGFSTALGTAMGTSNSSPYRVGG